MKTCQPRQSQIILSSVLLRTTAQRRLSSKVCFETNKLVISCYLMENCKAFLEGLEEPGGYGTMLFGGEGRGVEVVSSSRLDEFSDKSIFLTD